MPNAEMKTLTIGDTTYEIVDEEAREKEGDLSELNTQVQTDLVAAINEVADSSGVVSVNGMTGTVVLTAADVGAATTGALTDEATARTAADAQLQGQITALGNGAPIPVSTIAAMTDQTKVYLYTGSETDESTGYWYTYDSTQAKFVPRGEYGAGVIIDDTLTLPNAAAGSEAVGEALAEKADADDVTSLGARVAALESGSSGGLTADIKSALLACFANVAWKGTDGQDFYDALESALNPPANLTRITCVYTQSGTVYDTASLDDLKTDLVVTAHWSDNTTSTITTYTLSGTLTAGTSTITVSYSGKTTTFTVTVSEAVPSTYTKHGYIKLLSTSDKGRTNIPKARWIELRKYDNLNAISCEIEAQSDSLYTGTRPAMIGRRSASGYASSFAFYAGSNSSILGGHLHGTEINQGPSFLQDVRNVIKYTNTSASPSNLKVNDGEAVSVVWANNDTLNLAPVLFGNPVNDSNTDLSGSHRIGYIKIFDLSGDMIGYYIPVVRNVDNVIGMYDVITQTFYTASTSSYATVGNSNCIYQVGEWS